MQKIIFLLIIPIFLSTLILSCSSKDTNESEPVQVDNDSPVITLIGESIIEVFRNTEFTDPGATAYDDNDGDLTSNIEITGYAVERANGEYIITYSVSDDAGNTASIERTVIVYDDGNPLIGGIANGGVVFWVNPQDNTHGLVAAPSCEGPNLLLTVHPWRPNLNGDCKYFGPYSLIGNTEIGGGSKNTDRIIALNTECDGGIKTDYAAYFARNYDGGGYNDWYLPNITEIELIHDNSNTIYWPVNRENCSITRREIWSSNGVLETTIADQQRTHATAGYTYTSDGRFRDYIYDKEVEKYVLPIRAY